MTDHLHPAQLGRTIPAWVLDLLLGIAVTLVITLVMSTDHGGRLNPDAIAYGFAIAFGALMLLRRRYPVAVLVVTMLLLFAYYTLGYPAIGLAVPVAAALYSAAERGHMGAAVVVSFLLLSVSTHFRLRDGESAAYLLGYESVTTVALMAAAIALGINTRSRRALHAEQDQTARLIALEHAYRAEQRVQSERAQIARDLHDVIGHSISVISLHAGVAYEAIGRDDEEARQALVHIQAASSAAMRELRATVRLLRTPGPAADGESAMQAPPEGIDPALASLANLPLLVANATAGGLHVQVRTQGDLRTLPAVVDAAAFRIVQESLTNVLRHSAAQDVYLAVAIEGRTLWLRIADDGSGACTPVTPGSGIQGMAERARLLGGMLTAEPMNSGGFEVVAAIPLKMGSEMQ
jgi:signal transduction histidine kinase